MSIVAVDLVCSNTKPVKIRLHQTSVTLYGFSHVSHPTTHTASASTWIVERPLDRISHQLDICFNAPRTFQSTSIEGSHSAPPCDAHLLNGLAETSFSCTHCTHTLAVLSFLSFNLAKYEGHQKYAFHFVSFLSAGMVDGRYILHAKDILVRKIEGLRAFLYFVEADFRIRLFRGFFFLSDMKYSLAHLSAL